jgi:hypothetical protein
MLWLLAQFGAGPIRRPPLLPACLATCGYIMNQDGIEQFYIKFLANSEPGSCRDGAFRRSFG